MPCHLCEVTQDLLHHTDRAKLNTGGFEFKNEIDIMMKRFDAMKDDKVTVKAAEEWLFSKSVTSDFPGAHAAFGVDTVAKVEEFMADVELQQ